ncbi:MAG: FtsX-like permease family protein [Bacteroidales bacterium]|nr:FtsX-like permease family protein [Bacteroidales bacterium]
MNKKETLKSSLRILKRNKMRTFFMVLGIIIGVASLSITFTIGQGFQKQITERVKKYLGSSDLLITAMKIKLEGKPTENNLVSTLTIDDLKAIASEVPLVSMYAPVQFLPKSEIIAGNKNISTSVRGSSTSGQIVWNRGVIKGEYFDDAEELNASRVALIGTKIAETLFGTSDPIGAQIRIGDVPFTVKGVLEPKGIDPHGNDMDLDVIVPITTMMKRLMNVDYIAMAKIVLSDENRMDEAVSGITAVLNERHHITNGESDFLILTPTFVKEKIKEMTKVFNVFLPLISLIALFAAGIVIVVLMLMSVNERISEIGLRKAVGARSKDVISQFLIEVSITSLLGGIIGITIGLVCFKVFCSIIKLSFFIPWQIPVFGVLLPVIVGIIAGIIPARKAAKYNPIEALR